MYDCRFVWLNRSVSTIIHSVCDYYCFCLAGDHLLELPSVRRSVLVIIVAGLLWSLAAEGTMTRLESPTSLWMFRDSTYQAWVTWLPWRRRCIPSVMALEAGVWWSLLSCCTATVAMARSLRDILVSISSVCHCNYTYIGDMICDL